MKGAVVLFKVSILIVPGEWTILNGGLT